MFVMLFWIAVALSVYTYILFPGIVLLRGRFFHKPIKTDDITPRVSMIIAAHNEQHSIGAKLDNILSLEYPDDRLEVIIASDGSTDETEQIVRSYSDRRVQLLSLPRAGKAAALNAAAETSSGEVLVFSDANSMFALDAIRSLVRPFADSSVGGVAGDQRYQKQQKDVAISDTGERSYWNFDRLLKLNQSRAGNVISATGAIYAIRRSLFRAVPDGVTDDFVTSTRVISQGFRLVFAADAAAYEPVAESSEIEFGRKVRVITRGLRGVATMRELLNPFRHGYYAIQLFSHKVMRRLMVFPLSILLVANLFLMDVGSFYRLAAIAQLVFYLVAIIGFGLSNRRSRWTKICSIPYYFCMVNAACLVAVLNFLRGRHINRWEPRRHDAAASRVLIPSTTE